MGPGQGADVVRGVVIGDELEGIGDALDKVFLADSGHGGGTGGRWKSAQYSRGRLECCGAIGGRAPGAAMAESGGGSAGPGSLFVP